MNLVQFIIGSFIGRGARFFLVATVVMLFGDEAIDIIQQYGSIFTLIIGVVFVVIFVIIKKRKAA